LRRLLLCLVLLFVAASAATGVHASTECERWFIAYKNSLAQTNAAKKLQAANHRVRRYVHRKLAATYHKPKPAGPKLVRTHAPRPKMTHAEMLRRVNLACGELPEESTAPQNLQSEEFGPGFLAKPQTGVPLEYEPGTGLIASNTLPPYSPGDGGWPNPPYGGFPPGFGGGFGGVGTPGGNTPNNPSNPGNPGDPGTPGGPGTPVTPEVPEPSSVVLLLTGIAGAAGMVRRRIQLQD
jgi:hypothetical protein